MATSKLQLYNVALTQYLGERRLASLTENREPRRALDDVWDGGAVRYCLEEGHWKFAQRAVKLTYNPAMAPTFGYRYAFNKPSDCVKVSKVCSDEYLLEPLLLYSEEAGFWSTDLSDFYVSYVSDNSAFGGDLSLWPESFVQLVALYLAASTANRLAGAAKEKELQVKHDAALAKARSKDAMQGPTQFLPQGSWVRSRTGGVATDGGSRNSLYG